MLLTYSDIVNPSLCLYLPVIYVVYFCIRTIYRLTLHPLARFPGPKLAAATRWYEVYWEVYRGGRFSQQIDRLHQQYGPIIRVEPNKLHVNDPEFYDQLYNFSPDLDRPWATLDNVQNSPSFELHRIRRKALDPYFSKPAVLNLESVIRSDVEEFCQRLCEARDSKQPLSMTLLARCLTGDIMSEYLFARPYGFLTNPERSEAFFDAENSIFESLYMFRESRIMNTIFNLMQMIPPKWLPSGHAAHIFVPFITSVTERLQWALSRSGKEAGGGGEGHRVLFEDYPTLEIPSRDHGFNQIRDLALMLFGAGFETTAYTIETAIYHVLANPEIAVRLQEELVSACPDAGNLPSWLELEKLPYLAAVITESLRMSIGVMSRLPRKNMKENIVYKDWIIPKGSLVGMSSKHILYNKDIYPDPARFDPGRWLKGDESKQLQQKWLVSFSKGARRCLGMHLAYAELFITLATVFRRFQLELYETTRRDVDAVLDFFIPKPEIGGNGVRVLVH